MAKINYPQGQLDDMEQSTVQEIVTSLRQLHDRGKPQTDEEVRDRIDEYFAFCEESSIRPGIESLCMALHISRTTLFNWNNGDGCSEKRQEYIQSAKSFIGAFIEQAVLGGKISPPSGIFLMKNWLSYRDTISLEDASSIQPKKTISAPTPEEIAAKYGFSLLSELPELPEVPE